MDLWSGIPAERTCTHCQYGECVSSSLHLTPTPPHPLIRPPSFPRGPFLPQAPSSSFPPSSSLPSFLPPFHSSLSSPFPPLLPCHHPVSPRPPTLFTSTSLLSSSSPSPSLPRPVPPPLSHDSRQVRHYDIKQDETQKYFISEKHRFPSIKELIEYHKLNGGGLVTRLRRPPTQLAPNLATLSPMFGEYVSLTCVL